MEDYQVWERAAEIASEEDHCVAYNAMLAAEEMCVSHTDQCEKLDDVFGHRYFDSGKLLPQDVVVLALCFMAAISRDEKWNLELE